MGNWLPRQMESKPMKEARDEAFASCAMGNGIVVEPTDGTIVSPADGVVTTVMEPSLHAVGIQTKGGINILLHLGIDTVKMEGEGFKSWTASGKKVKAGEN